MPSRDSRSFIASFGRLVCGRICRNYVIPDDETNFVAKRDIGVCSWLRCGLEG